MTDEEIFRGFQFHFLDPGARSLGMGGAFVAIADDSTGLHANPAGLHYISEPELFVEFQVSDDDPQTFHSNLGSLAVDPVTGARDLPFLGLASTPEPEPAEELSFIGFAWPFESGKGGRRFRVAASRRVLLSRDLSLTSGGDGTEARFSFPSFPNTVSGGQVVAYSVNSPVTGGSAGEIESWNVGASYEIHSDFSLGATFSYATLDFQAQTLTQVLDPLQLFLDPTHPRLPGQATTDLYETTIDDADSDFTYTIGLHWHPDSVFSSGASPWRFGAVYRRGARFSVMESTFLNGIPDQTFENKIIVPDRYGVAVSYRTPGHWLFTLELERIEYSDMLKGFQSGVNFLTSGRLAGSAFGMDPALAIEFTADDGNLPRVGIEYVHPFRGDENRRITFQGGYFRMPDGSIRMTRFHSSNPDVNRVYLDAFRGGEEEDHFTAGVGFHFGHTSLRIAGDASDEGSRVVGNYVFRLGR